MRDGRWVTVTESQFEHERRGLTAIREKLRDTGPWRAWSNFVFTAGTGHVREVDLLVIAPGGVHLIELKDWHGSVESRNGGWLQTQPSGRQVSHGNPLHLANKKAKELASLLRAQGVQVWVSEAVCFTDSSLRNRLPAHDQHGLFTVHQLVEMLERPPLEERRRIDAPKSRAIATALERIGIAPSDAEYRVGPYQLDRRSFDSGPTWADYLARHSEMPEAARVRVYLRERGSDAEQRASVERAARREAAVLRRFRHPGVVQLKQYDPSGHPAGPALIFDYDPRTLRLDEYLAQYGAKLDVLTRMALVRQLAETVRSAHGRRIFHRTLAARAIHVMPRPRGRADGEEAGWLNPYVQISDWQVAVQRDAGSGGPGGGERFAPTTFSRAGAHLAEGADPYLAPELTAPKADPVTLDVYGLGVLTYLLATGQAPAASQAELLARFEAGEGLRPSAVVDGLSDDIDELVQSATAYSIADRLTSVDDFLDMLEVVEETLTEPARPAAPTSAEPEPAPAPTPEKDPLEAVAGDVLAGRWQVRRRLGTGSTSRAFLVRDLTAGPEVRLSKSLVVLKVALSERAGEVLEREAEVMGQLRPDSRIIRLVEPEPQRIADKTVLVLEYVGDEREAEPAVPGASRTRRREETVARRLRESGRLTVDQLEAYGDYLFGAVDFLEGEGVWHRDIKPDNIAIRVRPNRTRELVLIDFSLAGYPVKETGAGTDGYLDPFIGELTERSVYDAHAERYALAVTLHEMASGELPVWGGGRVSARQTNPQKEPHPAIAVDAFDPAVKDGLLKFFQQALHRDATKRFKDLKPMRDAWKRVFLAMDEAKPSSRRSRHTPEAVAAEGSAARLEPVIESAEEETAERQRDRLAKQVERDTPISASGLGPAAESFVYGLPVHTVGELLDYSQRQLVNAPGLGAKTRKEVLGRIKQWRRQLAEQPTAPLTPAGRKAAKEELTAAEAGAALAVAAGGGMVGLPDAALRAVSLDALATVFAPELKKDGSNRNECEMVRLLLRLPDERGELPDIGVWPKQKDVAAALGLSAGRIPQMLKTQRGLWKKHPAVRALRTEILELLRDLGRVAPAAEVADALVVRRGTQLEEREQRRALALAAVRAAVEVEQLVPDESEFRHVPNREASDAAMGAGLLALEVIEDDAPETPSAPGLLDYAQRLGKIADRLAKQPTLPTATTVLAELGSIAPPSAMVEWDERRTVELAAAASRNAAATPRLEIYPRDLPLVRALRLTQAGLVRVIPDLERSRQPGLTVDEVHERVRARFPELLDQRGSHELPKGGRLTTALREAGFDLELSTRTGTRTLRYLPRKLTDASSFLSSGARRQATGTIAAHRYAEDTELAGAVAAEERLMSSSRRDGFRVLTVRTALAGAAVQELTGERFAAGAVSVTELFLEALHELVEQRPKPTWETLLRADVADPGSKGAMKFAEYARTAWGVVEPRLGELVGTRTGVLSGASGSASGGGPLLLADAGVFARYDAMGVLDRLTERSRRGGRGLWLLCPQSDPTRPPRLGTTAVPYQAGLGEWVVLPDSWVGNRHRADGEPDGGIADVAGAAGVTGVTGG